MQRGLLIFLKIPHENELGIRRGYERNPFVHPNRQLKSKLLPANIFQRNMNHCALCANLTYVPKHHI